MLAREIQREYYKDPLARVNYLTRLPEVTKPKMGAVTVKAELSSSPCIPMQPIPDTAPTNITEGPKRVLNPAIGDRRGIEGSRRSSKVIEGDRRTAKRIEGDQRTAKDLEGPRESSKGRRRYSGYPYGFVRRWRGLSRWETDVGVRMKGQRRCRAVWG